jgi:hypothetical protein
MAGTARSGGPLRHVAYVRFGQVIGGLQIQAALGIAGKIALQAQCSVGGNPTLAIDNFTMPRVRIVQTSLICLAGFMRELPASEPFR